MSGKQEQKANQPLSEDKIQLLIKEFPRHREVTIRGLSQRIGFEGARKIMSEKADEDIYGPWTQSNRKRGNNEQKDKAAPAPPVVKKVLGKSSGATWGDVKPATEKPAAQKVTRTQNPKPVKEAKKPAPAPVAEPTPVKEAEKKPEPKPAPVAAPAPVEAPAPVQKKALYLPIALDGVVPQMNRFGSFAGPIKRLRVQRDVAHVEAAPAPAPAPKATTVASTQASPAPAPAAPAPQAAPVRPPMPAEGAQPGHQAHPSMGMPMMYPMYTPDGRMTWAMYPQMMGQPMYMPNQMMHGVPQGMPQGMPQGFVPQVGQPQYPQ